ncbi:MAG: DUF4910 domain-containing protein [Deltaproteobacteria bacterium]|nr:DUF4910 domain-containing protein [Deltaproteobacteria bacterium]
MKFSYNRAQMADALRQAGLKRGDVVFSHSNVGYFGYPEEGRDANAVFLTILGAFQEVIGEEGTLVVPTFTYSFCKRQPFDPDRTPSTCGMFTEMLRTYPGAQRSRDPIFAVSALGRLAAELTREVPPECFGKNSFWDRFIKADGAVCNLNFDAGSTFIHYVERCLNVPYRYDKLFPGTFIKDGRSQKGAAIFFCQDLSNPDTVAAFELFDRLARERGMVRSLRMGRGAIVSLRAGDVFKLIAAEVQTNPWFLTVAGQEGKVPVLLRPGDLGRFQISLPAEASMEAMIQALWRLPRDIVSDGYDAALEALGKQAPLQVHEYPTGTPCWTWIIPEKWTCREAYLETLDGRRLFSYADNPLHVVSYSLPFEGKVSREELFPHLHTHPQLPQATPFISKYYERDWGLCCSENLQASLTEDFYQVRIDAGYSYGTLKVGEVIAPGKKEESIVLCAHLCHPAMVNDDLAGVVVGLEVMRELLKRQNLRYTYRFLIVPETIGSIAYLSHHPDLIPKMKGGLFLEMLGLNCSHSLQLSFDGHTQLDQCFSLALKAHDPEGSIVEFKFMNDERQFNAPGVRVPMLALYRIKNFDADWPYPEYHSDQDSPEITSGSRLEDTKELVLRMINTLENDRVPINLFSGEIFLSRFGMHVDWGTDPEGNQNLHKILYLVDGEHSLADISLILGLPFEKVEEVVDNLHRHGLVAFED